MLGGETDWLCDVAFSPDGQTLAARASMSGAIQFWTLTDRLGGREAARHVRSLARRRTYSTLT